MADLFTSEPALAVEYLNRLCSCGNPADVLVALRQLDGVPGDMVAVAKSRVVASCGGLDALVRAGTYSAGWSVEDGEFVGCCEQFPSMSWLARDQEAARIGIEAAVREVLTDLLQ